MRKSKSMMVKKLVRLGSWGSLALAIGGMLGCGSSSLMVNDASPVADAEMADAVVQVADAESTETAAPIADAGETDLAQVAELTIGSGMRFATPTLTVPAGATIMVRNQDRVPHTVTSESAPDAFTPSGAFDTGIIAGGSTGTITIPANATSGTTYYYYCTIHTSLMTPPNGTIIVR